MYSSKIRYFYISNFKRYTHKSMELFFEQNRLYILYNMPTDVLYVLKSPIYLLMFYYDSK